MSAVPSASSTSSTLANGNNTTSSALSLLGEDDGKTLSRAICEQLALAKEEDVARRAQVVDPLSTLDTLSILAFQPKTQCTSACTITQLPMRAYLVTTDDASVLGEIRAARHMFLSPAGTEAAKRLRMIERLGAAEGQSAIHICSPLCPLPVYEGDGAPLFDADDPDMLWVDHAWHVTELASNELPQTAYWCAQHERFHMCGLHCDQSVERSHGARECPISHRVVTSEINPVFGDGTGTREQIEKTTEARGSANDTTEYESTSGRSRRRRRSTATRSSVQRPTKRTSTAAAIAANKKRAAATAAAAAAATNSLVDVGAAATGDGVTKAPTKRCKTSKAKRVTARSKQEAVVVTLTGEELSQVDPELADADTTTVKLFADIPFSEREAGRHDREKVLTELYNLVQRRRRRQRFDVPQVVLARVFFADTQLFARYCERAAAITYTLLFGQERAAIERIKIEQAQENVRKSVDQYTAARRKERRVVILEQAALVADAARGTAGQTPRLALDATHIELTETYYALIVTEFYFQFMSMPMPEQALRDTDTEQAVHTAFSFEQYVPIILDLMCADFTSDNITLLPHDEFLLRLDMPESMVQKRLGMPDRMSTHIKRLIKQRIRSARRFHMPMRFVEATTFEWEEIAKFALTPDAPRTLVEHFLARRADRLRRIRLLPEAV